MSFASTQTFIQFVRVAISQRLKRLSQEATHPPIPDAQIKEQFPYMPFKHPQGQFYLLDPRRFWQRFSSEISTNHQATRNRLHREVISAFAGVGAVF